MNRTDFILLVALPGAALLADTVLSRGPGREAAGGLVLTFLPWVAWALWRTFENGEVIRIVSVGWKDLGTKMNPFSQYQPDHLMCLVGTNPLPNYVAARLLAVPGKTVLHLLATQEVIGNGVYDVLASTLQSEGYAVADRLAANPFDRLVVSPADPEDIMRKVMDRVMHGEGTWGLNYTGGKKIMATHAYRGMEAALKDANRPETIFSYLDAETLEMVIEPHAGKPAISVKANRNTDAPLVVSLAQLLALQNIPSSTVKRVQWGSSTAAGGGGRHAASPLASPRREPFQPDFCREMAQAWLGDQVATMKDWQRSELNGSKKPIRMPAALSSFTGLTLAELASQWGVDSSELLLWLKGSWLEDHVLDCALALADKCGLNDFALGLHVDLPQAREAQKDDFQSDVLVMQGYRLFYISVTKSSDKKESKLKLFEAYVRGQRLGGDEAEVALVTFYDDPAGLEREIHDLNPSRAKVKVFGPSELRNGLSNSLRAWFDSPT